MTGPRILLFSERGTEIRKWQALQFEFEDILADVDSVELVAPPRRPWSRLSNLSDRVLRKVGQADRVTEPAVQPVEISGEYDLFFSFFAFPDDIAHLHRLKGWRERCDKAICVIHELFSEHVEENRPYLELLKEFEFDQVFLHNPAPAAAVQEAVGCPVAHLPVGVDALRFTPYPEPPPRSIDFYSFGRRSPRTHEAALELASRNGTFYVYDTVFNVELPDWKAHRELVAETMKRSKYFFTYRAGTDLDRGRADDVTSARYFEGTAGGALLLGSSPQSSQYAECFPWPDATIEIPYEPEDLGEIIAELERDPERLKRARRNNAVGALRRHDWVYRWASILDAAGLPQTPGMAARMERLEELAQ